MPCPLSSLASLCSVQKVSWVSGDQYQFRHLWESVMKNPAALSLDTEGLFCFVLFNTSGH